MTPVDDSDHIITDYEFAEYASSGARGDYDSALEDAEALWDEQVVLEELSELRRVRRSRYAVDVEFALVAAKAAIRGLRRGEFDEFDPDTVPRTTAVVGLFANAVNRALRETVDELLQVLADLLGVALGLPTGPTVQISCYAQPPPSLTQPRRRPAMPRAPATTASYQARGVLRAVA